MPVTVSAVTSIGSSVAGAVSGIKDTTKRRQIETALQRLSYEDKKVLDEKMARAANQNERLSLLVAEVNKYNIEQQKEAGKRETRNAIIIIAGSLLFLGAIFLITKKK